jgi:hypothetical protein
LHFVGVVPCKFRRKSIKHLTLLFPMYCNASFPPHYGRVTCAMQVLPTLGPSTVWNASVGTVNQLQRRCSRIPSAACPVQVCKINILFQVTFAEVFHIRVPNSKAAFHKNYYYLKISSCYQRFSSAHLKFSLKFLRSSVASSCRCSE